MFVRFTCSQGITTAPTQDRAYTNAKETPLVGRLGTRANEIKACVPESVHLVWARTVGAAIGVLRRDRFHAILLDHSLRRPESEQHLSGEDIAEIICETQPRDCKILVHSHSPTGALRICDSPVSRPSTVPGHPTPRHTSATGSMI
jgi:hypothetical protein